MTRQETRSALGVVFLTVFLDMIGFSIIFPLLPDMLEHYFAREGADGLLGRLLDWTGRMAGGETGDGTLRGTVLVGGILGSIYSALQFVVAPLWGRLSDRIGRKPVLEWTIAGLAVSYLLWFFADPFVVFVISRVLGGAVSGNISVATAAVADATDRGSRAHGMALVGVAFGLGFILGPAIGGLLARVDLSGLNLLGTHPFSAAAGGGFVLCLLNWALVRRRFVETLPSQARTRPGEVRPRWRLGGLFRPEGAPGVSRTNLAYFVYMLAFAGKEFTITFLAKDRFGYDRSNTHWIFVYAGLIVVLVQGGVVRRLVPRLGERKVAFAGIALVAVGLVATAFASSEIAFYAALGILAVGSALTTPALSALVSLYTPSARQGEILGGFRSAGALARALGPIAACTVYWTWGPTSLYLMAAILLVLPLALAAGLRAPDREEGDA